MPVDQRNSSTMRNRRLYKMKREVTALLHAARDMYALSKHQHELDDIIRYKAVLAELQKIRDSATAKAPASWRSLAPDQTQIEQQREAELAQMREAAAHAVAQRRAREQAAAEFRDKTFRQLGIDPTRAVTKESIKRTLEYERKVRKESTRNKVDKFLAALEKANKG